jgi:hypothetical protein
MMPALVARTARTPRAAPILHPGGPLWHHAPARDGDGRPLCDFMALVPGLREGPAAQELIAAQLQAAFNEFEDRVVFANLNLELGVAWITVVAEPGLTGAVADAIRRRLPSVRLVGSQLRPPRSRLLRWAGRVRALLR